MKTDLKKYGHIFKQEGTAQTERLLPALDPQKLCLDKRSLSDLLLYVRRYMKNVRFYDLDDESADVKNWDLFFKDDVIFLVAAIAAENTSEIKNTFDLLQQKFDEHKNLDSLVQSCDYLFSRFQKIYKWYASSINHEHLNCDLQIYIESYIENKLLNFYSVTMQLNKMDSDKNSFSYVAIDTGMGAQNQLPLQQLIKKNNDSIFLGGMSEDEKLQAASLHLNEIFDALFHVTDALVKKCVIYFNETLTGRQNHPPHIALLVAFLKLYGYVQDDFNALPQKHLDYYFEEILKIKRHEAFPDSAFITVGLSKGFDTYLLKKGSCLSAGKDATGIPLVYQTDRNLVINKASVASVKTLFLAKDQQQRITNLFANSITPIEENIFSHVPWHTFGSADKTQVTSMGFAIASDQLLLTQGERKITITFTLANDIAIQDFESSLISIRLTGNEGWLCSDNILDELSIRLRSTNERTLELQCSIAITQAASIEDYNKKIHGGNYNISSPLMQCFLRFPEANEQDDQYEEKIAQLYFLQKLEIVEIFIEAEVGNTGTGVAFDGVRNILVQNHEAVLNSSKPFYPFTGNPKTGSSFYITCNELTRKPVQKVAVNIEWMLPQNFHSYYDNYTPPYNANKFLASLSLLQQNVWKKITEISIIDTSSVDPRYRSIKIDYENIGATAQEGKNVLKADFSKPEGTLKFKLSYPDFGHSAYPQLITSSVMNKSNGKHSAENYSKIIRRQLHDSVISIKLPDDFQRAEGSLKAVYDIIQRVPDNDRAKSMLAKALGDKLRQFNGSNVLTAKQESTQDISNVTDNEGKIIVNDDNILNRVFGFLKKLRIIDKETFYDKDKQGLQQVADALNKDIVTKANFILPTDNELIELIINETNSTINKTVIKIADEIIILRKSNNAAVHKVSEVIRKEFEDANEVINDIIAEKIATLLLANEVPPPPYTPLINSISFNYISEKKFEAGIDRIFQVTPFGSIEIQPFASTQLSDNIPVPVNTRFIFAQDGVFAQSTEQLTAGIFFIGLKELIANENISILFQFAEGTRKGDEAPPTVHWHFISGNTWMRFNEEDIASDTTYGLQTTGIIEFSIPKNCNKTSTAFNEPYCWIAASVQNKTYGFPKLLSITTNAVTATYFDLQNDPLHFALPLPAGRINKLINAAPAIKFVHQPVASFNAKPKEVGKEFYVRISERLRHKNRAINNWDYERMVLENFPLIFKVKCINNYFNGNYAPGHITIVPICDQRSKGAMNATPLYPSASYILLKNIEQFISKHASPFIKIHALNPHLDHILVGGRVKFKKGIDKGYYLKLLNKEVVEFLTPWADGTLSAFSFSSKVYASSIINFIDKRPYVDYVTGLTMKQYEIDENDGPTYYKLPNGTTELTETHFTSEHAILVSAPQHNLELFE